MSRVEISESQIEDALSGNPALLAKYLGVNKNINLIARQLPLRGGEQRLDMLLSCGEAIVLVELKATGFSAEHLRQTREYCDSLRELQNRGDLLRGEICPFLLVTRATAADIQSGEKYGIRVVAYNPEEVMTEYFQRMTSLSAFLRIKPKDYGAYSIRRMLRVLARLSSGAARKEQIARLLSMSSYTIDHLLRGAEDFGLVRRSGQNWFLTDMGAAFMNAGGEKSAVALSEKQIEIIKSFVAANPFYSPTIFGVYAVVECAFLLARNGYPVQISELKSNFRMISGKNKEWLDHVIDRRTRAFMRFAVELELLGRIGDKVIITPAGFRFILMLQLRKSIAMIEGLSLPEKI